MNSLRVTDIAYLSILNYKANCIYCSLHIINNNFSQASELFDIVNAKCMHNYLQLNNTNSRIV